MKILIQKAEVIDPSSPYHLKTVDLYIENGIIQSIGENITQQAEITISSPQLKVSGGWLDMRVNTCDPGLEHKEDIDTVLAQAERGGFTAIASLPNTAPVVDKKESISYQLNKSKGKLTQLHPIAALTVDTKGTALTEMIDLANAGAVAFSDGVHTAWHTGIFLKSLQYLQKIDGLIINHAFDRYLVHDGQVNEGVASTLTGLKGIPALAESISVQKALEILRYTGGRLHFSLISTKEGIEAIRKAKEEGLHVTCDVAVHQLAFNDQVIHDFDTFYKVFPPLRDEATRIYLIQALKEGVIDAVVSDHQPQDEESKKLEFDLADFGILGLETLYAQLQSLVDTEVLINALVVKPRAILRQALPMIQEGAKADLTCFDPSLLWKYTHSLSKSVNSPMLGKELTGRVVATIRDQYIYQA